MVVGTRYRIYLFCPTIRVPLRCRAGDSTIVQPRALLWYSKDCASGIL